MFTNEKEMLLNLMEFTVHNYLSKIENLVIGANITISNNSLNFNYTKNDSSQNNIPFWEQLYYTENNEIIRSEYFSKIEETIGTFNRSLRNLVDVYNNIQFLESEKSKVNSSEKNIGVNDGDNYTKVVQ
ncbi:MAG: hypothetical protein ABIK31_02040 [candidate division WOR-3 bacterium]